MYKYMPICIDEDHKPENDIVVISIINLPDIGLCKIIVKAWEQTDIPHFHIISVDENGKLDYKFDTCLEIFNAKYFEEEKHDYLTYDQLSIINDTMTAHGDISSTNRYLIWDSIVSWWEGMDNYLDNWNKDNMEIPNYLSIKNKA